MKLFGSLRELVSAIFRKDSYEITVKPNAGTYTGAVEMQLPPKLTGNDVLVGQDVSQTLTNKTLTSPTINGGVVTTAARLDGVQVRKAGTAAGDPVLDFYNDGATFKISMNAPAGLGSNTSFVLPPTAGTASYPLLTDGSGNTSWAQITNASVSSTANIDASKLGTGVVSNTEFNYLDGVTSAIQTQINSKQATITGAATTITSSDLSASKALQSDASGKVSASSVTSTELGYVSGVTSAIQTQLGNKAAKGANSDITSLTGLTTALSIGQGGSGQTTANAALNAFLPSQGSSAGKYLKTDGSNTSWAAASGGSGEVNAILNPSAADGTTGWAAATNYSVTADSSNSPLNPAVTTCFALSTTTASAESSTSGISYAGFTMPASLQNRKLKIEFFANIPATSAGVWRLSLYDSGGTRVALSTDSSSVTTLPGGVNGKFVAYFDATSSATYSLRLTQTTRTSANTLYVTNVIVGPGIQPQGAVVGEWTSYTPSIAWPSSNQGTLDATNTKIQYRRVGSALEMRGHIAFSANAASAAPLEFTFPSGLTPDNSVVSGAANRRNYHVGNGYVYRAGALTSLEALPRIDSTSGSNSGQNVFGFVYYTTGTPETYSNICPSNFTNTGDRIYFRFTVPIAEWAGSGTVQLAQNDVEYAYNTSTSTTTGDTTSFAYGPGGAQIGSITVALARRVQFQTPIQSGDRISLELWDGTAGNPWQTIADFRPFNVSLMPVRQSNTYYGVGLRNVSSTQVEVYFGTYATPSTSATYGATGDAWSGYSSYYWRVRKSSAGAAVGFGLVVPGTSSGLVSASGLPGNTTGNSIAAGYVGEVNSASWSSQTITTGGGTLLATLSNVSVGIYLLTLNSDVTFGSATRVVGTLGGTATRTTNPSSAPEYLRAIDTTTGSAAYVYPVQVTTAGTITWTATAYTANTSASCRGTISLIRIA